MFNVFIHNTKSVIFKAYLDEHLEWEEEDELKPYANLGAWYNKIIKSCDAYKVIKDFDGEVRDRMEARIVGRK
jgi:hypothetical protein